MGIFRPKSPSKMQQKQNNWPFWRLETILDEKKLKLLSQCSYQLKITALVITHGLQSEKKFFFKKFILIDPRKIYTMLKLNILTHSKK